MPLVPRQGISLCAAANSLVHDPGGGLANDGKAHDHSLLRSFIRQEVFFRHTIDKTARVVRRRQHVINEIGKPVLDHIGCANSRHALDEQTRRMSCEKRPRGLIGRRDRPLTPSAAPLLLPPAGIRRSRAPRDRSASPASSPWLLAAAKLA